MTPRNRSLVGRNRCFRVSKSFDEQEERVSKPTFRLRASTFGKTEFHNFSTFLRLLLLISLLSFFLLTLLSAVAASVHKSKV